MEEEAYEIALTCALTLLAMIDANPGIPKYILLSRFVYAILETTRAPASWGGLSDVVQ